MNLEKIMANSQWTHRRTVLVCLLASALFHLVGVASLNELEKRSEGQVVRLQAELPPRFEPERLSVSRPRDVPRTQMEQLHMAAHEALKIEDGFAEVEMVPPPMLPGLRLQETFEKRVYAGKEQGLAHAVAVLRALAEMALEDTLAMGVLDLLRIRDLADADRERAMVIADPDDPRKTVGYINFTFLRVYGAGTFSSFTGGLNLDFDEATPTGQADAISDLARYMRDYTGILARVREVDTPSLFLNRQLLKDPIHFLFQGGGIYAYDRNRLARFYPEERKLLGEYLRGGGFLFIEGGNRYLREMVDELQLILGGDGRLVELPSEHPIYHAYYDHGGGFPGEYKRRLLDVSGPAWYYPARFPDDGWYPEGLWGVEVNGVLVAVLSDLQLLSFWSTDTLAEQDEPLNAKLPALQAATNIVVYALTREGGLTARRERPLWAVATGVTRRVSGAQPF